MTSCWIETNDSALFPEVMGTRFEPAEALLFVINLSSGAQDLDAKCRVIERWDFCANQQAFARTANTVVQPDRAQAPV